MPDPITPDTQETPKKEEEQKVPDAVKSYQRFHSRSMRQIAVDASKPVKEEKKEDVKPEEEEKLSEEKVAEAASKRKEEKRKERDQKEEEKMAAVAKKASEETAAKVTEEVKKEFQSKLEEILNKDIPMQEKQKESDALIASWEKEGRPKPATYKEWIDETMRIADLKTEQKFKALQEQKDKETKEQQEKEAKERADKEVADKRAADEAIAKSNSGILQDLETLHLAGVLKRPSDLKEIDNPDTKDEGAKEIKKILDYGIALNVKLRAEGKPVVPTFAKIYFEHYIKDYPKGKQEQPAGAEAPVAGANNTPQGDDNGKISYAKLHNETWAQTRARIARNYIKALLANR